MATSYAPIYYVYVPPPASNAGMWRVPNGTEPSVYKRQLGATRLYSRASQSADLVPVREVE